MKTRWFWIVALSLTAFALLCFLLLSPALISGDQNEESALNLRNSYANALMAGSSLAALLAALFAGFYAKLASEEARRQADISHQTLVSGERAWIKVDLQICGPFEWHKTGGPSVEIGVRIENIGRTSALNVHTNIEMLSSFTDAGNKLSALSNKHRKIDRDNSRLLLPYDTYVRPWFPGIDDHEIGREQYFCPTIIGCVTYQITADSSLHQTAFCFVLEALDGFRGGHSVPPGQIKVLWWAGGFAD